MPPMSCGSMCRSSGISSDSFELISASAAEEAVAAAGSATPSDFNELRTTRSSTRRRSHLRRTALCLAALLALSSSILYLTLSSSGSNKDGDDPSPSLLSSWKKQRRRGLRSSSTGANGGDDGGSGSAARRGLGLLNLAQYTRPADAAPQQAQQQQHQHQQQRQQQQQQQQQVEGGVGARSTGGGAASSPVAMAATGPRRVFYCGAPYHAYKSLLRARGADGNVNTVYSLLGSRIADVLFPGPFEEEGIAPIPLTKKTLRHATADDVVVVVMHQYCDVPNLDANFPGRQLHVNHEYYDLVPNNPLNINRGGQLTLNYLPPGDRSYMIGPHEDVRGKSVRLTYCQLCYATYPPSLRNELIQHRLKPLNTKRHFVLYAASHFVRHREEAAFALSQIGEVHAAGPCQGNHMADVTDWTTDGTYRTCVPFDGDIRPDNIRPVEISPRHLEAEDDAQALEPARRKQPPIPPECIFGRVSTKITQDYRFALVMENVDSPGYVTEKILGAFLGGSVPIYYGTTEIFDMFNENAFVYYDVNDPGPALRRIAYLEANPEAYEAVLRQPILADGTNTVDRYFSFFEKEAIGRGGRLKGRIHDMMGYVTAQEIERVEMQNALNDQRGADDTGWDSVQVYYGKRTNLEGIRPGGTSYSQAGQDQLVLQILDNKSKGYFIDLAANDATRLSNTLALEMNNQWMGLCIEPNPAYWYRLAHRKCHVVGAMVGKTRGQEVAARFDNGALGGIVGEGFDNNEGNVVASSSSSSPAAEAGGGNGGAVASPPPRLEKRYTVEMGSILEKFRAPHTIDYMSLDVEGAELFVMEAFPFDEYTISVLTVERPSRELQELLGRNGYVFAKLITNWGETLWVHESAMNDDVVRVVGGDDHPCWPPNAVWCHK